MRLAHGAAVLLVLRTLAVCGCHAPAQCASDDCGAAAHPDGWRTPHGAAACVCFCEQEPAALADGATVLKTLAPPFFVARWVALPQPQTIKWRARVEKPPPGLVLKSISQMLC